MNALRQALAGVYDIEGPLGRGGMALVYLARERRLDRRVALKVLLPELAADETCRLRFLSEARTIARLTHPNIVPIFTVDEVGGFVFFAMAYVAGETLWHRVATQGPLDSQQAGRVLCDIGEALDYAHARGVVHRDVKPDNILVNAFTGRALLTDFGIAHQRLTRIPYGSLGGATAAPGPIVGTAAFMSPEQASGGVVDGRSDIYSLGVVAYYALSGRLPLEAATDEALLALHINAQPRPLGDIAPSVPPRLAQVIDRCLAKQPWERFPDAAALVSAVTEAVGIPPAPLAVRAFLVRSTHLEAPALIHVAITGLGLLPAMVAAWVSPTQAMVRAMATLAFSIALLTPVIVTVARVRRLLAAGHRREELVTALGVRQARRREELAFVYGAGPTSFERSMAWVGRLALLMTAIAVSCTVGPLPVSEALVPYLWQISIGAGLTALLASMVSRARTEQRTDLIGERTLRFWRGPLGKAVFRIAALRLPTMVPRVTALDHLETPA